MHQPIPSERSDLQEAVQRLPAGGTANTRRARIPGDLWKLVCRVVKVHCVANTSREFKLDYYRLKR